MASVTETPETTRTRRDRAAGAAGAAGGAAYVVLALAGNSIAVEGGNPALGVPVELLAFAALACFVAYAATRLRTSGSWAAPLALVGGVTALAVKLGSIAPYLAAEHADLSPEVAAGLVASNDAAFLVSFLPHGLLIIGLALAGHRAERLPRPLSWVGVVLGLGCMAAVAFPSGEPFVVPFLLSLLWLIATSMLLVRGELRDGRAWAVEV